MESEGGIGEALIKCLQPDVKFEPAAPDIGFVHRKTDSGEVYFIANTGNTPKNVKATFRVRAMHAEEWDPMTGRVAGMAIAKSDDNGISVNLDLEPYASQIIVFTDRKLPVRRPAAQVVLQGQTIELSDGWSVSFGKDAKPLVMEKLRSWTDNENTRYFSGVAVYEKRFKAPAEMLQDDLAQEITLGEPRAAEIGGGRGSGTGRTGTKMQAFLDAPVREAAVVYINGKRRIGLVSAVSR